MVNGLDGIYDGSEYERGKKLIIQRTGSKRILARDAIRAAYYIRRQIVLESQPRIINYTLITNGLWDKLKGLLAIAKASQDSYSERVLREVALKEIPRNDPSLRESFFASAAFLKAIDEDRILQEQVDKTQLDGALFSIIMDIEKDELRGAI